MDDIKVLSKGNYVYPQRNDCVSLKQFVFASVDGKRRLLLNFKNDRKEVLSRLKFIVTFIDDMGGDIGSVSFDSGAISVGGEQTFPFEKPVKAPKGCSDFRLKVVAATYGDFVYGENAGQTGVSFVKQAKEKRSGTKKTQPIPTKSENRRFIDPARIGVVALFVLMLACIASFLQLSSYKKESVEGFILGGVRYAFATSDKEEGASVYVYGSYGSTKNVTIASEIEGYKVVGIKEGAFKNNATMESLTIDGDLDVYAETFYNCSKLKSLTVKGSDSIEVSAFENCRNLETVKLVNVKAIGEDAFRGCRSLKTLELSANEEGASVEIYGGAFADCEKLKSILITETALFKSGEIAFKGATSIESITLKNFGYGGQDLTKYSTLTDLFDESYYSELGGLADLKYVKIEDLSTVCDYFCYNMPSLAKVEIGKIGDGEIGDHAFENCPSLSSLSLSASPVKVGERAFANTAITEIPLGKVAYIGKEAFLNCASLKSVSIPASVERLYENTFKGCTSLEKVSFNENTPITVLSDGLFCDCASLKTINVPSGITEIGKETFKGCKNVESVGELKSVTSFGEAAFDGCRKLKSINIVANLTAIPRRLFADCEKLEEIAIPATVTSIADESFSGCKSVTEFSLPERLTSLGEGVFANCSLLVFATLPEGVSSIPARTFANCVSITEYTVPDNIGTIGEGAFRGCTSLERFIVGQNVSLGFSVVEGCTALSDLTVPDFGGNGDADNLGYLFGNGSENAESVPESLKKIKLTDKSDLIGGAFTDCGYVKEVVLENVSSIGEDAFSGCSSLSAVTLPSSLRSLDDYAFKGCRALYEVFNFSTLSVTAQSGVDGVAGYRAVVVYTDEDVERIVSFNDGAYDFVYVPYTNEYYVLGGNVGGEVYLPNSFFDPKRGVYVFAYAIATEAFIDNESITGVRVPYAVSSIGISAFESNDSLKVVDLSSSVIDEIRDFTFYSCKKLEGVYLSSSIDKIARYAFYDCDMLSAIDLSSAEVIGVGAFAECDELKTVELSTGLSQLSSKAFMNCPKIEKVTLPRTLYNIGSEAFVGDKGLREVVNLSSMYISVGSEDYGCVAKYAIVIRTSEYDSELQTYHTSDGYTFKYDRTSMTFYLTGYEGNSKNITLGTMIATGKTMSSYKIASYAFADNANIGSVTVGYAVNEIGNNAFEGCSSLTEFDALDSNVATVGSRVFSGCGSLEKIMLPYSLVNVDRSFLSGNYSYATVYYGGSLYSAESSGLASSVSYGSLYTYVDCIHDYGKYWMYDKNGKITTSNPYSINYTVTTQPTCTSNGTETGICEHCGRRFTSTVYALGHEYTERVIRQATCEQEGLVVYSCVRGDDSYNVTIPRTDHNVGSDGVCKMCGKKFVYVNSASFKSISYIRNDSAYPFDCYGTTISSTNIKGSSSSTLTITADRNMTVKFSYRLSGYTGTAVVTLNGYEYDSLSGPYSKDFEVTMSAGQVLRITFNNTSSSSYGYYYLYVEDLTLIY